jgi:hypothetical protein
LAFSGQARAEEWTRKSFLMPEGSFEITGDPARPAIIGINASRSRYYPAPGAPPVARSSFGNPFYIAPHFYWAVTDDLSLGISHRMGFCPNCDRVYNDAGFDLMYYLTGSNKFELDLHAGVPIRSFKPFEMGVQGGVLGRVNLGSVVALVFDPSVYIAFTNRNRGAGQELNIPFWFYFQATRVVVPFVGSSFGGPFDGFFDDFAMPLEGGMLFDVTHDVDVGFSFRFDHLIGPDGNADARTLFFLGRFRF